MFIKLTYEVEMNTPGVRQYGESLFDGITEHHVKRTFMPDGERTVEIDFKDADGNSRSFYVTGMAYVMSDSGKTIDTVHGVAIPKGLSADIGDATAGIAAMPCEHATEQAVLVDHEIEE